MAASMPDGVDLSTTLLDRDQIAAVLPHRHEMAMLDRVVYRGSEAVVGAIEITEDAWWVRGHLPGRPIFPGVLMLEAMGQLGSVEFQLRREEGDRPFLGFAAVDGARFRGMVTPTCTLALVCETVRHRDRIGVWGCAGYVDGELVAECTMTGVVIPEPR